MKMRWQCVLVTCVWLGTRANAGEFRWVGGNETSPDSWEESTNWRHLNSLLDGVFDDGQIPDQNSDYAMIDGQTVNWPHAYETRSIGQLDIKNGAKLYTGPVNGPSKNNSSILVNGPTAIRGVDSSLNVRSKTSLFPHVEFRTEDLLVSLGGDLQMAGGIAEVRGDLVNGFLGGINGYGTIRMADPDQDLINNDGQIVATGGTLRLTKTGESNAFLNLDGSNGSGRLRAAHDSTLLIDSFAPNSIHFGSTMSIHEGGVVDFQPSWNLGSASTQATLDLIGGASVATLRGGDVTSWCDISVQSGRGRIESNLNFRQGTISTAPNTVLELVGENVIAPAANTWFQDQSQIVVSGNTRVESSAFDWDGPDESAITHVKPGGLFSFIGTTLDGLANDHRFSGALIVDENATAHIDPTVPSGFDDGWAVDGTINLDDIKFGTSATLAGSRLRLHGDLTGNGTVQNEFTNVAGTVDPGNDMSGRLVFANDFETEGILNIDIRGTSPGTDHDQVLIAGAASLSGFLSATLEENYEVPKMGSSSIVFLSANQGVSGQFLNNTVSLGDGRFGSISYSANDVSLDMFQAMAGDSNGDGAFNSSDLVLVFRYGQYEDDIAGNSTWASGDWNGDMEFNTSDLILAFQEGDYSEASVVAVPEPQHPALVLMYGIAWCLSRKARRS